MKNYRFNKEKKEKKEFNSLDDLAKKWETTDKAIGVINSDIKYLYENKKDQWEFNRTQTELNQLNNKAYGKLERYILGISIWVILLLSIEFYRLIEWLCLK